MPVSLLVQRDGPAVEIFFYLFKVEKYVAVFHLPGRCDVFEARANARLKRPAWRWRKLFG
jgi:hypothetical protein